MGGYINPSKSLNTPFTGRLLDGEKLNTAFEASFSDPDIAASVNLLTTNANTYWSSMNTSSGATYLWNDLSDFTNSANVTASFSRLQTMAEAYA